jgi:thiamine kinase
MSPEDALSRIPGWTGGCPFEQIDGGFTNRSFLVRSAVGKYILRLDAEHTATFGIDRMTELKVLREAAKAGLAPEVRFADPDAGILLYEYLAGPVWERASLEDADNLERLAGLLQKVHALPPSGIPLDAAAAAERYAETASRNPELRSVAAHCVGIVKAIGEPASLVCCHNDVVAANIVGEAELKLLDWEYACDNDPYYDLASIIAYHDLGARHASILMDAYAGAGNPAARERLEPQLRRFDAIQWLWIAARYAIGPNPGHRARLDCLRRRIA